MDTKPTMTETTLETRHESNEKLNRNLRCQQVLEILEESGPLTAKEIAVRMCEKGFTNSTERNNAAPRLSELEFDGIVKVIGKKTCAYTGKTVAIYNLAV